MSCSFVFTRGITLHKKGQPEWNDDTEFPRVVVACFRNCSSQEVVKIAALSITWSHTAGSTAKGRCLKGMPV